MTDTLVDFIIIGAQKCGTTYLSDALSAHPEVCLCDVKEPFYFNRISEWDGVEAYHALYKPEPGQICGEGSTHYTFLPLYPDTARRIKDYNPDMKLIYLMRHPFKRALSLYRFKRIRGETSNTFTEDVMSNPEYLHVGRYYSQLYPYLECFSRDQLMVIIFEEFVDDAHTHLCEVSRFLGIDEKFYNNKVNGFRKNKSTGKRYPPSSISLIKKVLRPLKSVLGAQAVKFAKDILYSNQKPPEYPIEFREAVTQSFHGEISQVERDIVGRQVPSWSREYDG